MLRYFNVWSEKRSEVSWLFVSADFDCQLKFMLAVTEWSSERVCQLIMLSADFCQLIVLTLTKRLLSAVFDVSWFSIFWSLVTSVKYGQVVNFSERVGWSCQSAWNGYTLLGLKQFALFEVAYLWFGASVDGVVLVVGVLCDVGGTVTWCCCRPCCPSVVSEVFTDHFWVCALFTLTLILGSISCLFLVYIIYDESERKRKKLMYGVVTLVQCYIQVCRWFSMYGQWYKYSKYFQTGKYMFEDCIDWLCYR